MNDLRRLLLWLATLLVLAVGIWGFQLDEVSEARPFARENRAFRQEHRIVMFGHEFALPLRRMLLAWGGVALATAALWPLATQERSGRAFGRWARPPGGSGVRKRSKP